MNIIFLLGFNVLGGCVAGLVHGAVTYASPFDLNGHGNQINPHFPEAVVTYGPVHQPQTAPQSPSLYPSSQQQRQRSYYAAQSRPYNAPGVTRSFAPFQQTAFAQPQPKAYSYGQARPVTAQAQQRSYPSIRPQPYVPVNPQVYSQIPRTHPAYPQQRAYSHSAFGQRTSTAYFVPAAQNAFQPAARQLTRTLERQPIGSVVSQPMNKDFSQTFHPISRAQSLNAFQRQSAISPIRSQPNNAFAQQAIKAPQMPVARTFAPKPPTIYRPVITPMTQVPQGTVARPAVPLGLGMYGRNRIPKTPGRNTVPGKPIPPGINRPMPPYPSNKRNNIAFNPKPQAPEETQVARNYINGISIPQTVADRFPLKPEVKLYPDPRISLATPLKPPVNPSPSFSQSPNALVNPHVDPGHVPSNSINKPIRPQINPYPLPSLSLNTPINSQLSKNSSTDHRLSSFLRSVKNLNDTLKGKTMKQGLVYYDDDVNNKTSHRPTNFAPPTRKLGSMGSPGGSRVTFTNEPVARPAIIPETIAMTQTGSERVTIAQTDKNVAKNDPLAKNVSRQNETVAENTVGLQTPQAKRTIVPGKADAKDIQVKNSLAIPRAEKSEIESTTSTKTQNKSTANVVSPQAKNTLDLTRTPAAAQVDLGRLKEKVLHSNNTKFLKRVLQVLRKYTKLMKSSMAGRNESKNAVLNASITESNTEKENIKQIENPKNLTQNNETASPENGMEFANALNSTKAAVDIFDKLNNASARSLNSSVVEHIAGESESKNSTLSKDISKKSNNGTVSDIMSSNSEKEHSLTDENASKKEKIETGRSSGKHAFNLDKLKHGLERGNTVD